MKKKDKGINTVLEDSINKLLEQVMSDEKATLMDKCRVLDRAINVEKLKLKLELDEWGSGFSDDDADAQQDS